MQTTRRSTDGSEVHPKGPGKGGRRCYYVEAAESWWNILVFLGALVYHLGSITAASSHRRFLTPPLPPASSRSVTWESYRAVRERRRLSPPAWVAVPSLQWVHLLCINPWETMGSLGGAIIGKPRWGTRDEWPRVARLEVLGHSVLPHRSTRWITLERSTGAWLNLIDGLSYPKGVFYSTTGKPTNYGVLEILSNILCHTTFF